MRFLHYAGHQAHIIELPELAFGGYPFFSPQPLDECDALFIARTALGHRNAEYLEFLGQEGTAEARIQPTVTHVVEHCQITAQVGRVMKRWNDRTGDHADALGARRHRRQEHARVG